MGAGLGFFFIIYTATASEMGMWVVFGVPGSYSPRGAFGSLPTEKEFQVGLGPGASGQDRSGIMLCKILFSESF